MDISAFCKVVLPNRFRIARQSFAKFQATTNEGKDGPQQEEQREIPERRREFAVLLRRNLRKQTKK
jgi:hypothetical protein